MDIKKFEAFVKVVESGSLSKAAVELGSTQSGISYTINVLEEEFGFPLLQRDWSGVKLTTNGERVMPAIRGILNCNEQLTQIVASIHGLSTGTVRVGTFTSVAVNWLPDMMKEFQEKYPNVEIVLMNGDYHDVEQWVSEGMVDLGFIPMPSTLDCECIKLREDRLLAILPRNHRLAELPCFPVEELKNEPYISLLKNSDQDALRICEAAGVKRNIKFTTKDDYALIAMVEKGLGISIIPELLIQKFSNDIVVKELSIPAFRTIGLAIPAVSRVSPSTSRFADHICEWVKNHNSHYGV